ncbi:NADH:ubiquinone oxidoreductase complex I intermediate-associated protein 30 [Coccomyxa subellipsoidea C-169]|uniref:NADH:ubiquinone oxidoreductase complex I intermediate-associated protein 30 n=1 Tax=Coccomyxa subellipsoidea (strain C-169) TaxID=574566 RepID=I0YU68_COCSC|nr:NADH:ubiquinone oxidoreductase complex I intermediate-associated protein 30 [Coccomyxa subellipsoidea C-169]EIE21937.1 NADH:ubiquinone oxidoreductase complex I intermediate-associated protein 30 [Coccomyxa subellipsoidea C-169]|eukprot:XP_005646481.1 NADH:ubiquinone oxidoreductase complex I intermediate-associated protein 30 [Coccomyxa subellipsoidea C-169]
MAWKGLVKQAQRYLDKERLLYQFASAEDLTQWKVFTDREYGGQSTAELSLFSESRDGTATASFHGNMSVEIDEETEGKRMQRSGFAGLRTEEMEGQYMDVEGYDALAFRMRSDGRKYIANLRTANWIVGEENSHDVWQAFLLGRKGAWQEVVLPMDRFLLTHKGRLVETRSEMNPHRIVSLGISLAAGGSDAEKTGPFCLDLEWIKAVRAQI